MSNLEVPPLWGCPVPASRIALLAPPPKIPANFRLATRMKGSAE